MFFNVAAWMHSKKGSLKELYIVLAETSKFASKQTNWALVSSVNGKSTDIQIHMTVARAHIKSLHTLFKSLLTSEPPRVRHARI